MILRFMKIYRVKTNRLKGTNFQEVHRKALVVYAKIKNKSKRRPYVRSTYFNKEKIFLGLFWSHLFGKPNWRDRVRRLQYFPPAIELIQHGRCEPQSKENPNKQDELFHRFSGITSDHELFYVQIKEDKRTGQKWLISIFPDK